MPSPDPTPPRSVLSPWQRPLVKALVLGGIFLAATGLFLAGTPGGSPSASGAFVLHVIVGALPAGLLLWERSDPGRLSVFESADAAAAEAARGSFFPSLATSGAGGLPLSADDIRDVKSCATCHRQITEDWKRSAHRHASM